MKSLKRLFLALAALIVAAGILTSTASAGTGELYIDNSPACDITFNYSPGSGALSNVDNTNACSILGGSFDIDRFRTALVADFAPGGTVSISGDIGLHIFNTIGCLMSTSAPGGGGPLTGTYSGYTFSAQTPLLLKTGTFGTLGCPDPWLTSLDNVEIRNGTI